MTPRANDKESEMETETSASTDAPTEPAETEGKAGADAGTDDAAALKKALEKERVARREADKRAKALEPFEKQAKEAADAAKSETQKLTEALEAERSKAASSATELMRFRTAADKGVPMNLVRFLAGTTAEEIAESADLLMKEVGVKPAKGSGSGTTRPAPRLDDSTPSDAGDSDDPMKLIEKARAGRF